MPNILPVSINNSKLRRNKPKFLSSKPNEIPVTRKEDDKPTIQSPSSIHEASMVRNLPRNLSGIRSVRSFIVARTSHLASACTRAPALGKLRESTSEKSNLEGNKNSLLERGRKTKNEKEIEDKKGSIFRGNKNESTWGMKEVTVWEKLRRTGRRWEESLRMQKE